MSIRLYLVIIITIAVAIPMCLAFMIEDKGKLAIINCAVWAVCIFLIKVKK